MLKSNLRQKTYGIFVKPYFEYAGDRVVHRGNNMSVPHPCRGSASCPPTASLQGGEPFMLNYTSTSFINIRIKVKELMDEIGLSVEDIIVTEITPINHIVTPLS